MSVKFLKFLTIITMVMASLGWSIAVLAVESWEAPTDNPPSANRFRPINTSNISQEKSGALVLSNTGIGLLMRDSSSLMFGIPDGKRFGFKGRSIYGICVGGTNNGNDCEVDIDCPGGTCNQNDVVWTLPITDGANGNVLKTDGNGNLSWQDLTDTMTQDEDFGYKKTGAVIDSIGTKFFTRFLNSGNIDGSMVLTGGTMPDKYGSSGPGDVFVESRLEVNGSAYFDGGVNLNTLPAGAMLFGGASGALAWNSSGNEQLFWDNTEKKFQIKTATAGKNAEIYIQSGSANTHWGIYQENSNSDLRFWNTNNQVTFTNAGRVGIGTTDPLRALDVAGGIKLTGLFYDSGNNTGGNGQILSSNGSNIKWIDQTWWTNSSPSYVYSTQNTRVGSGGTVDQASGAGDLYVQNKLEVDGSAYFSSLSLTGFTSGSVIFQGANNLAQNNPKFFWTDNDGGRLGVGTSTPSQALEVKGNFNFTDTSYDGSSGAIMFGGRRFVSSLGKSLYTSVWTGQEEYSNTYIGTMAGSIPIDQDITTDNTAIGFYSLNNNIIGAYNTAIGSNAMFSNNDGIDNVAIGANALYSNTTGNYLTAIGYDALHFSSTASELTAVGYSAGYSNDSGTQNIFFGNYAGYSNYSGSKNTYLGYESGKSNELGSENVFVGYRAGLNNATTNNALNTMIGSGAGSNNYTGVGNIFLGRKAGSEETGNYKLYIDSTEAGVASSDPNKALIYGQFYSSGAPDSYLRFNGKVGITPRGTTNASFNANSLLHLYRTGANAELDIQSVSGSDNHWGIYQDSSDLDLRFWKGGSNRVIFADSGEVAIGGNIVSGKALKVYGDVVANNYWSADATQKGNTAYVCVMNGAASYIRMRFEDGLYICSCVSNADCANACTCTNS